ncbi:MAG: MarC family protein, partial [Pseudomonadota bacterium]
SACLFLSLIIWIALLAAPQISRRIGTTGMNIVTRIMGLVLASLAIDFMVAGLGNAFPGLMS